LATPAVFDASAGVVGTASAIQTAAAAPRPIAVANAANPENVFIPGASWLEPSVVSPFLYRKASPIVATVIFGKLRSGSPN
jgi:hypothetical protein